MKDTCNDHVSQNNIGGEAAPRAPIHHNDNFQCVIKIMRAPQVCVWR